MIGYSCVVNEFHAQNLSIANGDSERLTGAYTTSRYIYLYAALINIIACVVRVGVVCYGEIDGDSVPRRLSGKSPWNALLFSIEDQVVKRGARHS